MDFFFTKKFLVLITIIIGIFVLLFCIYLDLRMSITPPTPSTSPIVSSNQQPTTASNTKAIQQHHGILEFLKKEIALVKEFLTSHPAVAEEAKKVFTDVISDTKTLNVQNIEQTVKDVEVLAKDVTTKK